MQSKKALGGLLAMGVVLALAALGLVYTNWDQTFTINGNVSTGTVEVNAIRFCDNAGADCAWDNEGEDQKITKDIARCIHTESGKTFTLTISNGYPGYQCHFWLNITNKGQLPVTVTNEIKNVSTGITVTQVTDGLWDPVANGYPPLPGNLFLKGDCKAAQLAPGETTLCDFDVALDKNIQEGAGKDGKPALKFTINVLAELLNKPAST